jgi:peptidoglycan/LPS O-acetylase OafA/YrhL
MLAAFALLELEKRKIKRLTWWQVLILNIVAFTCMGISVFGSSSLYANLGQGWTQLQTVLYITFSRLLFGIGLACMMHMFYMGHNYLLRKGFEWHIWAVMARLTFSTYLWHPILMTIYFFNQTSFAHYSATTATSWFFTFVIGGFVTAIFGFLLVERPMMNLEKFLMPGHH